MLQGYFVEGAMLVDDSLILLQRRPRKVRKSKLKSTSTSRVAVMLARQLTTDWIDTMQQGCQD